MEATWLVGAVNARTHGACVTTRHPRTATVYRSPLQRDGSAEPWQPAVTTLAA